jgi:hypothetical protein
LAPPLAALQAAINAAASLSSVYTHAVYVFSKKAKDKVLYHVEVGLNRWAGAFSDQGFSPAGQRAKRGVRN